MNHSATPKAILTKVHDCTYNLNVYIFSLRFALGTKNNYFSQINPPFLVVEIITLLLFEEMLILTSY